MSAVERGKKGSPEEGMEAGHTRVLNVSIATPARAQEREVGSACLFCLVSHGDIISYECVNRIINIPSNIQPVPPTARASFYTFCNALSGAACGMNGE